jgi:hypothetical protein
MKIVITESQYKIIKEHSGVVGPTIERGKGNSLKEQNLSLMAGDYNMYNQPGKAAPFLTPHEALQAAGLVAGLFIGATEVYAAGVLLSSLFGAADATLYYKEGDKESAVLAGSFALLPYIGKGVSKIPGVKELGTKGMAMLASKLSSGAKLNNVESQVVKGINTKKSLIQQELKTVIPKLSEVNQTVKSMRNPYIKKFGQQKYDELLGEFISGKLTKEGFINNLKSAGGDTYKLANFSVKGGIKFLESELKGITDLVPYIKNKNFGFYDLKLRVNGEYKNVRVIVGDFPKKSWDALAAEDRIYVNMSRMEGATEQQIRQTLYHEATHIKDPSLVSPKLSKAYKDIENAKDVATNQFKSSYAKAMEPSGSLDDVKTAIASKEEAKNLHQQYLYHKKLLQTTK